MPETTAMKPLLLSLSLALFMGASASFSGADNFHRVAERESFLNLVQDRALTRLGIRLQVTEDGQIRGRAFGRQVTGGWRWQSGYFCRDLFVGGDELGANCQMVQVKGNTIRFTSDRGQGAFADLRIR
ncbi:MAG: dihydrodipicolinate reductase [Silicimonas sp.]|nr:dihydrodipicolinate reductase [Silicimonas sp.]